MKRERGTQLPLRLKNYKASQCSSGLVLLLTHGYMHTYIPSRGTLDVDKITRIQRE